MLSLLRSIFTGRKYIFMKLNYILPLLKSVLLMSVILMLVYNNANVIKAETNGQETVTDTSGWSDYDYKDIDKILKESSYNSVTFEDIVDSIYLGNSTRDSGKKIVQYITEVISSNRNDCMKILILCILSAFINVFGPFFNKQQLTESTLSVIAISLITVLFVVFIQASETASSTLTSIINLYKAISMVFLPAISASGAIMSKAVYYQIIIAMIAVSNIFFKNILLKTNKIYLIISLCDCIDKEAHMDKACNLIKKGVKWCCYTILTVFIGLNAIKSILTPVQDTVNSKGIFMGISLIPGIGDTAQVLSNTILSSSALIKNAIGVSGIIAIVMCMFFPLLRIGLLAVIYQGIAAGLQPISDKRMVRAVSSLGQALGMIVYIMMITLVLFILTIAIICVATNCVSV